MAPHSSTVAWKIPWTEKPGGLQSLGLQSRTRLSTHARIRSGQSLSRVWPFATPWTAARQAPCPSLTPRVYSNSCPLSRWCHPTISFSVVSSSCLQFFPASGFFQMSQFFGSGGQSIGVSASASVLSMNIQSWFPFGLTIVFSGETLMFILILNYALTQR